MLRIAHFLNRASENNPLLTVFPPFVLKLGLVGRPPLIFGGK